ncbi:MAG: 4Fe-4S dicluster domain-containing protein [Phycisphaerae bacterium]
MPRFGFAIDNRACIGCHACTVACKSEHEVPLGVNRTWVKYIEKGEFPATRRFFNVQRCNHCEDAPCVEICPVTSLYQRPDGIVDFDNSRCIGCKACMQACPYDALFLDPQTLTAAKCNYCTHRVDAGYEPACVVVCPVEAIVSGDLDDPESKIAQLDRLQRVQYPKPEKATRPKLFYVGGEAAALDPAAAPPENNYLWSGNDGRITLPLLRRAGEEAEAEARARRTYDPRSKPAPWGWMVSAYITTKAIAAGLPMVAFIAYFLNLADRALPSEAFLLSMLFLAVTGALLAADLKQPRRFLWVLLRPQWRSWLVRGAYMIAAYSLLLPFLWLLGEIGAPRRLQLAIGWGLFALANAVAAYTALLLAQAKGRDYWQSPLLVVSMIVDALVAGAAMAAIADVFGAGPLRAASWDTWLGVGTALTALLVSAEFLPRHPTRNAELTATLITRGALAPAFWGGGVIVGIAIPAALLLVGGTAWLAAIALLVGVAARNHVLVQAPQRVPLS